jgi:hypothetical protein
MSRYDLTDFEWRVIGEGEPTGQLRPLQPTIECRAIRWFEAANSMRETDGCAVPRSLTFAEITGLKLALRHPQPKRCRPAGGAYAIW